LIILLIGVLVVAGYALVRTGVFQRLLWPSEEGSVLGQDAAASADEDAGYVDSQFMMDTYVSIRAFGEAAESAVAAAFEEMRRVEALMSRFIPTSDVSRVNQAAGAEPVQVSEEAFMLIERALEWSEASGGAFDVTIGPVVDAWGFGGDDPRVPDPDALAKAVALVSFRAIELDPVRKTVRLATPGMCLDLGGIAKGYAADRAAAVLRERGVKHALIDAGGNIVAVGSRPDGTPWHIGIRDPRGSSPTDTIGPVVEVSDAAVVTSGDYERFFIAEGQRYHHIFDPKTGMPANLAESVTIVAPNSLDADALSTAVFVLGPSEGLKILEGLEGVSAMVVDSRGQLVYSPGFPGH
jgi:thiamine biosynthesis lipoprotein